MLKSLKTIVVAAAVIIAGSVAHADGHAKDWTLDAGNSKLAFGSIKKNWIGETHSFRSISGGVAADGTVSIEVNLASVETNIDIRNERMIEHVFRNVATATLSSEIDMAALTEMPVGGMNVIELEGTLSLVGTDIDLDAEMFVVRLSEDRVMAMTDSMIFLDTEEAGIDPGINKLMELAELPGITRAAPVTMRLVFDAN